MNDTALSPDGGANAARTRAPRPLLSPRLAATAPALGTIFGAGITLPTHAPLIHNNAVDNIRPQGLAEEFITQIQEARLEGSAPNEARG